MPWHWICCEAISVYRSRLWFFLLTPHNNNQPVVICVIQRRRQREFGTLDLNDNDDNDNERWQRSLPGRPLLILILDERSNGALLPIWNLERGIHNSTTRERRLIVVVGCNLHNYTPQSRPMKRTWFCPALYRYRDDRHSRRFSLRIMAKGFRTGRCIRWKGPPKLLRETTADIGDRRCSWLYASIR